MEATIQEFDFLIEHIPGPDNIIADAMSLCPDHWRNGTHQFPSDRPLYGRV
jgi:hypothetical protein